MSFKIINNDEPLPEKSLITVLFGEPGTGKTSLSFTAKNPLLLDFDQGVERSVGRKTVVKFESWQDAMDLMNDDYIEKNDISSLIVDTAGTMLDDYMASHIIKLDSKYGNGAGGLGLRGYGVMKDVASQFITICKSKNVDVIFICHTQEIKDGDEIRFRPKMTGGSYDILISKADLVGYMEMKNNEITLNFNPTSRHIGKNCAEFPPLKVPNYKTAEYADYMHQILEKTKDKMNKANDAQLEALKLLNEVREELKATKELTDLEEMKVSIDAMSDVYKSQLMQTYNNVLVDLFIGKYINSDTLKEPEDFDQVADLINGYPKYISTRIKPEFKVIMEKSGVLFDKETSSFLKDPNFKPPTDQAKKTTNKVDKKEDVPAEQESKQDDKKEPVDEKVSEKPTAEEKDAADVVSSSQGQLNLD